jgi:glutathione S-transferase
MHTLYYAPGAASMAVHWLLLELDLPHELVPVDLAAGEQRRPGYLALNPAGVVPTLVSSGEARAEAAALLVWLADAHPQAGLAPPVGDALRGPYLEWMFLLANGLQPLFRQWWYPDEVAGEACAKDVREHVAPRIAALWDRIDARLATGGPYLLGERLTAADFYLVMLMRWSRNMPRPATDWAQLDGLAARLKSRPSFATLYEREGLTEWS